MEHVNNEAGRLKMKRGRKPKADKQQFRCMIRLNSKDNEKFLSLFRKSGHKSKSRFIADCVLSNELKIVEINKSAIDFVILLSSFFTQFRGIKNNFNQMYGALVRNLGEEKARSMIQIVAQSTREFGLLKQEFEEYVTKLKEKCLPK